MPKVSVIVNTVSRVEDLRRCLDSLFNQTFKDFEVVVVNNGQDQETKNLLEQKGIEFRDSNFSFKIVEDGTKKLSYLFNLGWKKSDPSAKYLAYLADDTEADPQYLSRAVEYLENHPPAAAVSGPVLSTSNPSGEMNYLYDLAKKNLGTKFLLRIYEYLVMEDRLFEPGHWCQSGAFTLGAGIPQPEIKGPLAVDLLTSTSLVVRRSVMEEVAGFDENFLFNHADGDLFIRIKKLGYKLIFHPLVQVIHHMRFGPTRYPQILGRDTAFYFLKDVRPKSLKGWLGLALNIFIFNSYFIFKAVQLRDKNYLKGIGGFAGGILDFFFVKSPQRNDILSRISAAAGFLLLLWLSQRAFWSYSGMLAFGDAYPFPSSFQQAFRFFFSSFDPRTPGGFNPQDGALVSSLIPLVSFLALLFGGNFILAQRLFYAVPIPLSFLTMYFFLSRVTKSRLARFAGAFVYSSNHFVVAEFTGGFTGNLYAQALLPIFLWQLRGIFESVRHGLPWLRKFLLYSGLLAFAYVLSDHILLLLFPFWLIFTFGPIFVSSKSRIKSVAINFGLISLSLITVLFLSAYHVYPYLRIALPYLVSKSIPVDVIPFFVTNVWDTYWKMSPGNVLRLGGSYFVDFFGTSDAWAKVGFALPVFTFSWYLFPVNRRGKRFIIGLFFTCAAVLVGLLVYATGQGLTLPVLTRFPLLFRFRNPSRLMLLLSFFYAPLITLSFDGVVRGILSTTRNWGRRSSTFSLILLGLASISFAIYYFSGVFSGDYSLRRHRGEGFKISPRYYSIGRFMDEEHKKFGLFRTAYFPWNHEETEVKLVWLDPYSYSLPITYGAYVRDEYSDFISHAFRLVSNWQTFELGSLLAQGGVKYVVLNSQSTETGPLLYRFDYQTPWLLGSYSQIKKIVEGQRDLRLVKNIEGFEIYENTAFNFSNIDLKRAGFYQANQNREDLIRRLLILGTGVSWLVWLTLVLRPVKVAKGNL